MTVYNREELQALLGIGKQTAYRLMKEYGFRIGYSPKSPLRITEEQVKRLTEQRHEIAYERGN